MLYILLYNCFDVVFPDVQVLNFVIARRYYGEINVLRYSSTRDPPLLGIGKKCQAICEKKSKKCKKKAKKK